MTELLAGLFTDARPEEIGEICYLLQGRVAPLYEAVEFGIADKLMIRAIAKALGFSDNDVVSEFKHSGDLGVTAQNLKSQMSKSKQAQNSKFKNASVSTIFQELKIIAQSGGEGSQEKKITLLADLITSLDPLSVRYVVRIPLGKLRLGFSDMTILDAFSWMLAGDKSLHKTLEEAYNVRPDMAYIGKQLKERGVKGVHDVHAVVGAPILASLCARLPDAEEMIKKMGEVDVEPKYDGVRTQIHFKSQISNPSAGEAGHNDQYGKKDWVQSFSRNLENTTAMYPELTRIAKQVKADEVILDSEAVGYDPKTDKLIPFQETVTRKRKHDVDDVSRSVPLRFFVFDILYKNGKDLMREPLSKRREILEDTLGQGDILSVSPNIVTSDVHTLRKYHNEQLAKGLEGVVVKKWNSPYEPGRKGFHWVKFKEEEGKTGKLTDTIDAVVMGYTSGEGKRTEFGIGQMLLGVKDHEEFVTVTKLGSGATDAELGKLFQTLKALCVPKQPKEYKGVHKAYAPDYWVIPKLVLEIAGDDLTKSPTHGAGYALRFPRLVRIREDKSPTDVTTVEEIRTMYHNQKSVKQK